MLFEENIYNTLSLFQKRCRDMILYKRRIVEECKLFNDILYNIDTCLLLLYNNGLINNTDYKKYMDDATNILENMLFFNNSISFKFINTHGINNIFFKLAEIKNSVSNICFKVGIRNLSTFFKLYGNCHFNKSNYLLEYLEFLDDMTHILSIKSINILSTNSEYVIIKNNDGELTKIYHSSNYPTIVKINDNDTLLLKNRGCLLYILLNNKVYELLAIFRNDNLNIYQYNSLFIDKTSTLHKLVNSYDINDEFKENFINSISLRDFLTMNEEEISNNCLLYYSDLNKLKDKCVSQIVKDFVNSELSQQRYIIILLLMDSSDKYSKYLANLLYDLLKTNSSKNYNTVYDSIHWTLQKLLRENDILIQNLNQSINNFNEDNIPYDKKILLMKASDSIKNKAFEKLKEINNSKNSESNAKAIQYLDGLLKIPFGIYKKEYIKIKLDELKTKYDKYISIISKDINKLEEEYLLSNIDITNLGNLSELMGEFSKQIFNPINLDRFTKDISKWIKDIINKGFKLYDYYDYESTTNKINKYTKNDLVKLSKKLKLSKCITKKDIIKKILEKEYFFTDIEIFNNYDILGNQIYTNLKQTTEFNDIINNLEQLSNLWVKYLDLQSKYFKEVNAKLDDAVYGLPEAKKQIKRLLAQWINGNDQGYVFGFEGPPGTGKTTLAKQGIARCLKDEYGNQRPFVFIALGGSSNGSTLEGHNYTYVGSTWGKIVDGLMDSKCMNPIIYIDELDKISKTEHGKEIIGILTHLTDPSQNTEFTDKYFTGIKFDISKCLIVFSYNDYNLIDKILLDRIQRIKIEPLTKIDKVMVCKEHIIPEILKNIGFNSDNIVLDDNELIYIIDTYTYEAGARKLKEKLYELYREINLNYLTNSLSILPFRITKEFIDKTFEHDYKVEIKKIHNEPKIGLINGLFATSSGIGGITVIEAFKFISSTHLELKLTGMQGDVMKESMNVAKTLALNIIPDHILHNIRDESNKFGLHIHCPSGATPKDGPSAGTAITIAIISLLCNIPIINTMAITGEIDLNGNVLPIGGLESKVDGGKLCGVTNILCPSKNSNELAKIRVRKNPPEDGTFTIEMIDTIYQALERFLIMPSGSTVDSYFKKI